MRGKTENTRSQAIRLAASGLVVAACLCMPPGSSGQGTATVSGCLTTYNHERVAGREVNVRVWTQSLVRGRSCEWLCVPNVLESTVAAVTDANGCYSASYTKPDAPCWSYVEINPGHCFQEDASGYLVDASTFGSEATTGSYFFPPGDEGSFTADLKQVPDLISPNGHFWARRVGPVTPHAIVDIEGFDPGDNFTSEKRLQLLACSRLEGSELEACEGNFRNLRSYLSENGYTFWQILAGPNGGNTQMGTAARNYTDGGAYQAMSLTRRIAALTGNPRGVVVGGYSMGGSTSRAGLRRWCGGEWAAQGLPADCRDVALWWSGDAPLDGAVLPVAAQRYVQDRGISSGFSGSAFALIDGVLLSPAARELGRQWINPGRGGCKTNCKDLGGCDSREGDFDNGSCFIDNSANVAWRGFAQGGSPTGFPMRDGDFLPGIAFGVGMWPHDGRGDPMFFKTEVKILGDHKIRLNNAGGVNENLAGSTNNSFCDGVNGIKGSTFFGLIGYTARCLSAPPYIPTESALFMVNGDQDRVWKDYNHNTYNRGHADSFPTTSSKMLMGWVHEYLKGEQSDSPICDASRGVGEVPGGRAACRTGTTDYCGNQKDDDGDERVDQGCFSGSGGVGVDYLKSDLKLPAATCAAYCASLGKTCSNSCTTNRGFRNWGVEAWVSTASCQAYETSGGQASCTTDLAAFSNHGERKYRCCCEGGGSFPPTTSALSYE